MPYVRRTGSTFIEICSSIKDVVAVGDASGNTTLNSIVVPNYQGSLSRATLEMQVMQLTNENAAVNYLDAESFIQLQDASSTWRTGISIPTSQCWIDGSAKSYGSFLFSGAGDLKAYIQPNTTYAIRWYQHNAHLASINFYNVVVKMKLYFN